MYRRLASKDLLMTALPHRSSRLLCSGRQAARAGVQAGCSFLAFMSRLHIGERSVR
jgi:hypothetical protein